MLGTSAYFTVHLAKRYLTRSGFRQILAQLGRRACRPTWLSAMATKERRGPMSSSRCLLLIAVMLPAALLFPGDSDAAAGPQITGVWACEVSRPGSVASRPLVYVIHADGTAAYSSQTTVNGGPIFLPFTSRGGGNGQWQKLGSTAYRFLLRENMYVDGNAGGFFYVDATQHLDTLTGQLCSGRPECPAAETKIRLTQFTFDPAGTITGEVDLLPPDSRAASVCSPLSSVFTGLP